MKIGAFIVFFLCAAFSLNAQTDTVRHGSIKVSKTKDTLYLRAFMKFDVFLPSDQPVGKSYGDYVNSVKAMEKLRASEVMEPFPLAEGYSAPFDFTDYFRQKISLKELLIKKETDTIRIRVDVRKDGKYFYKNLSELTRISNKVVVYDEGRQAYVVSETNNKSMEALKEIRKWQPAYRMVPRRRKLKGTTVIKPEMEKLHASGVLTIIFSKEPLEIKER